MSLLDILVHVATATFVVGWVIVIVDAVAGFRLIERLPSLMVKAFGAIHNVAFIGIAVILTAGLIWRLTTR